MDSFVGGCRVSECLRSLRSCSNRPTRIQNRESNVNFRVFARESNSCRHCKVSVYCGDDRHDGGGGGRMKRS